VNRGQGFWVMNAEILLIVLIIIGLVGRSPIIATAASFLLVLKLTSLEFLFIPLEERSLEIGLLFLTMAVLVPFANEQIGWKDIKPLFTTWLGILAFAGGAFATYMNGMGLELLQLDPEMIIGLVVGSIFGIIFLRGVPVGPLMAAGVTVFLLKILQLFS
jgi:uncharacterized membrane protein (DUF441 family)